MRQGLFAILFLGLVVAFTGVIANHSVFADDEPAGKPAAAESAPHDHAEGEHHENGGHAGSGDHGDVAGHVGDHGHDDHGHHAHIGDPEHEPAVFEPKDWRYDLSAYSLVVFLLLLAVLKKFAWGPVMSALDEREANIRKNIEEAEAARVRAEQLMAERTKKLDSVQDEVREILAEARRDADHTRNDIVAQAQKEAEATKNRALEEIKRAQDQALNDLFGTLSGQVTRATEQVIGRALTDDDRNRLVSESLAELSRS